MCFCSHRSLDNSSTTRFPQCITLGKAREYGHATKAFQPLTLVIPLEDTIVALH
jgi:hypothetical protein